MFPKDSTIEKKKVVGHDTQNNRDNIYGGPHRPGRVGVVGQPRRQSCGSVGLLTVYTSLDSARTTHGSWSVSRVTDWCDHGTTCFKDGNTGKTDHPPKVVTCVCPIQSATVSDDSSGFAEVGGSRVEKGGSGLSTSLG